MNTQLLTELLLLFTPLIAGLTVIRFVNLGLRNFQVLYLILGLIWITLHYLYLPEIGITKPIIVFILGEMFHLLIIGMLGSKIKTANLSCLMFSVGLFPWYYMGLGGSVIYVLLSIIFIGALAFINERIAKKKFGVKMKSVEQLNNSLDDENFKKYISQLSMIISLPILLSILLTILIVQVDITY